MAKFDLKELARRGAEARVAELETELAAIRRAFPGLRAGRGARAEASDTGGPRRRGRRRMTAAQRKAVSARMKKYWAGRRKAQE